MERFGRCREPTLARVLELFIALVLIGLNGLFAVSELAVVSVRKPRLKTMVEARRRGAAAAMDLAENPGRFLSTVSGMHAVLKRQAGSWLLEDLGSTNGSYADHNYERKTQITLMHGGEAQVGECRVKLVSFGSDSPHHRRAKQYLSKRCGLTGLLVREYLMKHIDEDGLFADWAEAPMQVARYELRGPNRQVSERPTILEILALRRAAQRVVDLTEMLLLSLTPAVAGRTGPLKFVVSMVGPTIDEARHVVEQVVSQVQGMLPETLDLAATLVNGEHNRPARTLID